MEVAPWFLCALSKWEGPAVSSGGFPENFLIAQWFLNAGVMTEKNNKVSEKFLN